MTPSQDNRYDFYQKFTNHETNQTSITYQSTQQQTYSVLHNQFKIYTQEKQQISIKERVPIDRAVKSLSKAISLIKVNKEDYPQKIENLNITRNILINSQLKLEQKFKVMSYNILADYLVDQKEYTQEYHQQFVQWQLRWHQIYLEIQRFNPEIICLQELEGTEQSLCNQLKCDGYQKIYVQRSDTKLDGCSIHFKTDRFKLINEQILNLSAHHIDEFYLDRPNVVVLAILEDKQTSQHVLVANCHLLFNHNRGDIKILQIQIILACIRKMIQIADLNDIAFIWCGDFNSIPCSQIYEYLSQGSFDFSQTDIKGASCQINANVNCSNQSPKVMKQLNKNNVVYSKNNKLGKVNMKGYKRWLELFIGLDVEINNQGRLSIKLNNQSQNTFEIPEYMYSAYAECTYAALNLNGDQPVEWRDKDSTCEPFITTMSRSTKATVDYVWYCNTYNNLRPLKVWSVLELPLTKQVIGLESYPNHNFPSDHFPLVVEFGYNQNK